MVGKRCWEGVLYAVCVWCMYWPRSMDLHAQFKRAVHAFQSSKQCEHCTYCVIYSFTYGHDCHLHSTKWRLDACLHYFPFCIWVVHGH